MGITVFSNYVNNNVEYTVGSEVFSANRVGIYGTPVANQIAIWKTSNSIEGVSDLTIYGDLNTIDGSVDVDGPVKALGFSGGATSTGHMLAYNGTDGAGTNYRIGIAYSGDGFNYYKSANNPIISYVGSSWEHDNVKDPCLLKVNDIYYIFYTGFSSANTNQVGVSTSRDGVNWTKYASNPVLTFTDTNNIHRFPTVIYDENETVATKKWKMWYVDENWNIAYAYGPDAYTWTKYSGNPVLEKGTSGSWDEQNLHTGPVYYDTSSSTWYLYYGGKEDNPAGPPDFWQTGYATFTDPEGTYTKYASNPIIERRSSAAADLTANTSIGETTVTIGDTSVFEANEYVYLYDDNTTAGELNRIFSIDSATELTLRDPVVADFTTAQNALIRSLYYGSISPKSIFHDGDNYLLGVTSYQILNDLGASIREHATICKSTSLVSGWEIDIDKGIILQRGTSTDWDYLAVENPSIIPMAMDEQLGLITGLTVKEGVPIFPSFTTTQRNAISSPVNGMVLYNTTTTTLEVYEDGEWLSLISGTYATDL